MTEQHLLEASTGELAGVSFDCACGRRHKVDIESIHVSKSIEGPVASFVTKHFHGKPVLVVSDGNTFTAQGGAIISALQAAGVDVTVYSYDTAHETAQGTGQETRLESTPETGHETAHMLVPDEKAVGELLLAVRHGIGLIIAVGSGTLNDLCRIVSDRMHIPYIVVCTAPSVDGYASTVSPLIIKGHKTTLEAVYPMAIFADPDVLRAAPAALLHAGFGDLLGKVTALTDWELARQLQEEYHCPVIEKMVRRALEICIAGAAGVAARESGAVTALFDALVLSGLAMGMIGNSRPASGAEHHLSHYWEMDALKNGETHALHGNAVGSATVAVARTYELLRDLLPDGFAIPDATHIRHLLKTAGAAVTPADLGISRELFHRSMLEAMHVRPRYTILRFAEEHGRLEEIADILTAEFYGA